MKSSQRNADLRTLAYDSYFTEYNMKMKEMDNYQTSSESDSSSLSKSSKSESMSESFDLE